MTSMTPAWDGAPTVPATDSDGTAVIATLLKKLDRLQSENSDLTLKAARVSAENGSLRAAAAGTEAARSDHVGSELLQHRKFTEELQFVTARAERVVAERAAQSEHAENTLMQRIHTMAAAHADEVAQLRAMLDAAGALRGQHDAAESEAAHRQAVATLRGRHAQELSAVHAARAAERGESQAEVARLTQEVANRNARIQNLLDSTVDPSDARLEERTRVLAASARANTALEAKYRGRLETLEKRAADATRGKTELEARLRAAEEAKEQAAERVCREARGTVERIKEETRRQIASLLAKHAALEERLLRKEGQMSATHSAITSAERMLQTLTEGEGRRVRELQEAQQHVEVLQLQLLRLQGFATEQQNAKEACEHSVVTAQLAVRDIIASMTSVMELVCQFLRAHTHTPHITHRLVSLPTQCRLFCGLKSLRLLRC